MGGDSWQRGISCGTSEKLFSSWVVLAGVGWLSTEKGLPGTWVLRARSAIVEAAIVEEPWLSRYLDDGIMVMCTVYSVRVRVGRRTVSAARAERETATQKATLSIYGNLIEYQRLGNKFSLTKRLGAADRQSQFVCLALSSA
jgi:hypothetical protein